jgi:hypothetical protein
MKKRLFVTLSCLIIISITVCATKEKEPLRYDSPLLPGAQALRKITNPHYILAEIYKPNAIQDNHKMTQNWGQYFWLV